MSRRFGFIVVLLCCLGAVTFLLVHYGSSRSPHLSPPESSETDTTASPSTTESDLHLAHADDTMESVGMRSETRPSDEGASAPVRPVQESDNPQPGVAASMSQPAPINPPGPVAREGLGQRAEAWSYPPLIQQNASNQFVRAMVKLSNAKSESDRYYALGGAAKSDFIFGNVEEARRYATELLALDERFKGEPWRDGGAVYDGNLVLGRIAAQEGRIDEAKQYLLEAGKSTGSPVLGSFGPNMSLARDLLQKGERDTVLGFFDLCGKFWTVGQEKLALWSEEVKAGRMPDFAANLFY